MSFPPPIRYIIFPEDNVISIVEWIEPDYRGQGLIEIDSQTPSGTAPQPIVEGDSPTLELITDSLVVHEVKSATFQYESLSTECQRAERPDITS